MNNINTSRGGRKFVSSYGLGLLLPIAHET